MACRQTDEIFIDLIDHNLPNTRSIGCIFTDFIMVSQLAAMTFPFLDIDNFNVVPSTVQLDLISSGNWILWINLSSNSATYRTLSPATMSHGHFIPFTVIVLLKNEWFGVVHIDDQESEDISRTVHHSRLQILEDRKSNECSTVKKICCKVKVTWTYFTTYHTFPPYLKFFFVRSFVRTYVRSFVRSFVCSFFRSFVR